MPGRNPGASPCVAIRHTNSIIPDPYNPLDYNRYAYTRYNPVKYTDPSGHCPICLTAVAGALIGGGVNYGVQVFNNLQSGMELKDAALSVDVSEIVVASAAGGVAGLTMGVGTAILGTSTTAVLISGTSAGVIGGQAEAFTEAGINEVGQILGDGDFNAQRLFQNAHNAGFINGETMAVDAATGAVTALLGRGVNKVLGKVVDRVFGPSYSSGGPSYIKYYGDQIYIEVSGMPGLHLEQSELDALLYAAAAGLNDQLSDIFEEILNQQLEDVID